MKKEHKAYIIGEPGALYMYDVYLRPDENYIMILPPRNGSFHTNDEEENHRRIDEWYSSWGKFPVTATIKDLMDYAGIIFQNNKILHDGKIITEIDLLMPIFATDTKGKTAWHVLMTI